MNRIILCLIVFAAQSASARTLRFRTGTVPVSPSAAPASLAAPVGGLGLTGTLIAPTLSHTPIPQPLSAKPAAARETLAAIQTSIRKAEKNGGGKAAPIARAYDGVSKKEASVAAVSIDAGAGTAPRSPGLSPSNFADSPSERTPVAAPRVQRKVEYAPIHWRKAAAGVLVWLALVGAVALEYGGLYYAFTHAPRVQPTESELHFQQFEDDFRDFGF